MLQLENGFFQSELGQSLFGEVQIPITREGLSASDESRAHERLSNEGAGESDTAGKEKCDLLRTGWMCGVFGVPLGEAKRRKTATCQLDSL